MAGLCAVLGQHFGGLLKSVTDCHSTSTTVTLDVDDDVHGDYHPTRDDYGHACSLDIRRTRLQGQGRPLLAATATRNHQVCRTFCAPLLVLVADVLTDM